MRIFILFFGVPVVAIFFELLGYHSLSMFMMFLLIISTIIMCGYWIVTAIVDAIIFRIKLTSSAFRFAKVATDSLDLYDIRIKKLRRKLMAIVGVVVVIISIIGFGIIRVVDLGNEGSIYSNLVNMYGNPYTENSVRKNESEYQYSNSIYKVGVDMPAGEYYVEVLPDREYGYYSVNQDANGQDIYLYDNVTTHSYITVTDGQYVELTNVYAVPVAEAPSLVPEDGLYTSGVYKVGIDIPAGEYKVTTSAGKEYGHVEIYTSSTYQEIVAVENLVAGGSTYITVTDGQYLILNGVEIQTN